MGRRVPLQAILDPASSARWFTGWTRPRDRCIDGDAPAVANPHTWLLDRGWRRHGLISPAEVPGYVKA